MNIINIYLPQILRTETRIQGTINTLLTGLILACVLMIIIEAIPKWIKGTRRKVALVDDAVGVETVIIPTETVKDSFSSQSLS